MNAFGYDPRSGPIGYQAVEFLDIPPTVETSATNVSFDAAQHLRQAIHSAGYGHEDG